MDKLAKESVFALIATPSVPELGPERRPGTESSAALKRKLDELDHWGAAKGDASLVRALVLLWHDHLDEAHTIAQDVGNSDGSFVHGIMHRREPDYGNAAYWFRRVGNHSAFREIGSHVAAMPGLSAFTDLHSSLLPGGKYDPFGLITVCERFARSSSGEREVLREVQAIETRVLLERFLGLD